MTSDFAFVNLWPHSIAAMAQSDSAPPTGHLVLFPLELCPGSKPGTPLSPEVTLPRPPLLAWTTLPCLPMPTDLGWT